MDEAKALERISLPPGWRARAQVLGRNYVLTIDAGYEPDARRPGGVFPKAQACEFPRRQTAEEVAFDVVATLCTHYLHEAFEHVTLDGVRLAAPHPHPQRGDFWDWMSERLRALAVSYGLHYPPYLDVPPPEAQGSDEPSA